jgi:Protein of unknown function (DUF2794)
LSEGEPIVQFPRSDTEHGAVHQWTNVPQQISFDRKELNLILNLYGRYVASGEWRDYAMDFGREAATFSIFRRSSEVPLYRIVKNPALARKQGVYAVIAQGGLILKRGHDLAQVLAVLVKKPRLAAT